MPTFDWEMKKLHREVYPEYISNTSIKKLKTFHFLRKMLLQ